jgi:hypothetical protein
MKSSEKEFIAEVYSHIIEIEGLIKKHGFEDRVMSAIMIGVLDIDLDRGEDEGEDMQLKSIFSYNLQSKEELEVVKEITTSQFESDDPFEDLFDDLGISLN